MTLLPSADKIRLARATQARADLLRLIRYLNPQQLKDHLLPYQILLILKHMNGIPLMVLVSENSQARTHKGPFSSSITRILNSLPDVVRLLIALVLEDLWIKRLRPGCVWLFLYHF